MKFAFVSAFAPYRGGIAQFNHRLFAALDGRIELAAFNFSLQYPAFLFPGKTQYAPEGTPSGWQAERVLNMLNPISWVHTALKVRRSGAQVLVFRYWMPFFAPAFALIGWLCRLKGIKVIAILDNLSPHENRPGDRFLNKLFLSCADGFIVMSTPVKQELFRLRPKAAFRHYPHPLYDHFGQAAPQQEAKIQLGIPQQAKVLLFFGLIRPYKGLDLLIEAFTQLNGPDWFLLIVGEPYGDEQTYRQLIAGTGLSERIRFIPEFVPDSEVGRYFGAADLCVLPYKSATQSGIVAIAAHFGLPVVVTDTGGLKESVQPWQIGQVADEIAAPAVAKAIEQAFEHRHAYRQNIDRMRQAHSWNGFATELLQLAEQLTGSDK